MIASWFKAKNVGLCWVTAMLSVILGSHYTRGHVAMALLPTKQTSEFAKEVSAVAPQYRAAVDWVGTYICGGRGSRRAVLVLEGTGKFRLERNEFIYPERITGSFEVHKYALTFHPDSRWKRTPTGMSWSMSGDCTPGRTAYPSEAIGVDTEFQLIQWSGKRCLLPTMEMNDFCVAVSSRSMSAIEAPEFRLYVRQQDTSKIIREYPAVGSPWNKLILKEKVFGTVSRVIDKDTYEVSLSLGRDALKPRMHLFGKSRDGVRSAEYEVLSMSGGTAKCNLWAFSFWRPEVGDIASSMSDCGDK